MVRVLRARRPGGVHKRVVKVLLDVINDLAGTRCGIVCVQSTPCGRFDDRAMMAGADGGFDVRTKQRNDAILIRRGYITRYLTSITLYRTRLTSRHALFHEQMIATKEPAAEGARTPASRGRFAATRRTLEFEWNGEHLSAVLSEVARTRLAAYGRISEECLNYGRGRLRPRSRRTPNSAGCTPPQPSLSAIRGRPPSLARSYGATTALRVGHQ